MALSGGKRHFINEAFRKLLIQAGLSSSFVANFALADSAVETVESTGPLTYYVATDGNDENDGLSTGTAFLTIQRAVEALPKTIRYPTSISIGEGTFTKGFALEGFQFQAASSSTGAYLSIEGTLINATPATGTATGTATAGAAGSSSTQSWGTLTDSGQTWTTNDLRGLLLEITGGTGVGQIRAIDSNTGTVITIAGGWTTAPASGSTYAIRDWGTDITGSIATPPTLSTTGSSTATQAYVGECNFGFGTPNILGIQKIKFSAPIATATNGIQVKNRGGAIIRYNRFVGTGTNLINSIDSAAITVSYNTASIAAGNVWLLHQGNWEGTFSEGNVVVGGATGMKIRSLNNSCSINGSSFRTMSGDMIQIGGGNSGVFRGLKLDTSSGGYGIDSDYNNSTTPPIFALSVLGTSIAACNLGGLRAQDGGLYSLTDVTGTNTGPGITVNKGGKVKISTATAVTGSSDISEDGVTSTYANLRGLTPKQLTDATTLSTIWEP